MSAVLKRKMFMQPPVKKASGGILSIVEEEEDSYEDRTPENIEILTNNLRGDVRSMDERYDELAQMVGEEQAAQTPPEVIALLQTKLVPQQPMPPVPAAKANGIAGLMGGGQQGPQQPPMPGQPPMGGPQPPMPGQPPMPPGPPPTPTGEPPVQRQKGSDPLGELKERERKLLNQPYSRESGAGQVEGEGFRIDVGGVGDLPPVEIPPVHRIPEITAAEPPPRIPVTPTTIAPSMGGGMSGFSGSQPAQQGPSALDVYNMENNVPPPQIQSADAFVDGYASQGGDLNTLANYLAQPQQEFDRSNDILGNYLADLARQDNLAAQPQGPSGSGIESLVNEPQAPRIPQEDLSTIDDVAQQFNRALNPEANQPLTPEANQPLTPETIPPVTNIPEAPVDPMGFEKLAASPMPQSQQAPQQAQRPQTGGSGKKIADALSGAGLGKLLGALGALGGLGKGKSATGSGGFDNFMELIAFASPHRGPGNETMTDAYLDMFGKIPGGESQIDVSSGSPNIADALSRRSDVEVFPVKPSNIGVRSLAPQKPVERSKGSTRAGERIEPSFNEIKDVVGQNASGIRANDPFNLPGRGVQPMPPVPLADFATPKSRPLTLEELAERRRALVAGAEGPEIPARTQAEIAERVAAGERRTLSPATRTLYEMTRQMGIDPVVLTDRLNKFSNVMKKIPGLGKLFKGAGALSDVYNKLGAGKKAAIVGGTSLTAGALLSGDPKPNDGVVPPLSKFGVEQIPTEYDTQSAPVEGGDGAPPDIGKPLEVDMFPGLNRERDVRLGMDLPDAADNEYNRTKGMDLGEVLGPRLPETDEEPEISAVKTIGSELGIKGKPGDDDYEAEVRKQTEIYQRLLGDDPNDRQMKAYLLLAEAGLKMMTGKGRNTAEIISGALQGLPSGFAAIASESSKIKRAATAAAISDVNARRLAKTKADATIQAALARSAASNLPRQRKIDGTAAMLAAKEGRPADDPVIMRVAEGLVDGYIQTDTHGNFRGPDGAIAVYGESTKFKENDRGYIPADSLFLIKDPPRPVQITDEAGITKVKEQIYKDQVLATEIEKILTKVGDISGLSNVIKRSIAKGTVPIFGDLGPLTERSIALENYAKAINPLIKDAMRINQGRLLKMEAEQLKDLEFDPERFFTTPGVELAKLSRTLAYVKNSIASQYASINPQNEYRQMDVPPMGTQDDPLPSSAISYKDEYFSMQPNGRLHVQLPDGSIKVITKEWNDAEKRKQ